MLCIYFLQVKINNDEYTPDMPSANKKQAKAAAASVALQKMGLIPAQIASQTTLVYM